jgi:probable phosphoglycerate mutase
MLLFYVRHGEPIYEPDSLTPLGHRQAEAIGKRLALYGVDEVYASTSERARLTALPTAEMLRKEIKRLDFANEAYAWKTLTTEIDGYRTWLFSSEKTRALFHSDELIAMGDNWHKHPELNYGNFGEAVERIQKGSDEFFLSLGYKRIGKGKYEVVRDNDERIAFFAHQGFGLSFLSCVLGIAFPHFTTHFDICHSGMTVIEFKNENGYSYPRVLMLSADSHLYKEGLPTRYIGRKPF